MKTKAIRGHHDFVHGPQQSSMIDAIISILKYIIVVVGIALMAFK